MKQLTCEMCGSTDIAKQDGFFVCQTCGMKYSVEEAKKQLPKFRLEGNLISSKVMSLIKDSANIIFA